MRLRLPFLAAALLATACDSTAPIPDAESVSAAQRFQELADSVRVAGGDPNVWQSYSAVAAFVLGNGRVAPVTITVDGVSEQFLATAHQMELDMSCPSGAECPPIALISVPPLRTLVAWQKSDPRRLFQLTSTASNLRVGDVLPINSASPFLGGATLTWFDGSGGVYTGTSGTQSIEMTSSSDVKCPEQRRQGEMVALSVWIPPTICTLAEFTARMDATVSTPVTPVRGNTAAGTHTIAMAQQGVPGSRRVLNVRDCLHCGWVGYPYPFLPPVALRPTGWLSSRLTTTMSGTDVRIQFEVTNTTTSPVEVRFASGQEYDFIARSYGVATPLWRWSADKGFTLALHSKTLDPGMSLAYVELWRPPGPGRYLVSAEMTSASHLASAVADLTVP